MGLFFPNYGTGQGQVGGERYSFVAVGAAHLAALSAIAVVAPPERLIDSIRPFAARIVELQAEKKPALPPPPAPKKQVQPQPVMTTQTAALEAPVFAVAPQPPAVPVSAPPAPAVELPVVGARFDADYLDNPKPVYPHASRRLGEQGKVLLRVFVSAVGHAEKIEIKASSGFERLDAAAREAVARWRFVPARRGEQTLAAWVQVPITFQLDT